METPIETLYVTVTPSDKRALKVLAATRGETVRDLVRGLIRREVTDASADR